MFEGVSRREMLGSAALVGGMLAFGVDSAFAQAADAADGPYTLPPLPYDYADLEPHIDAQTMKLHHDIHHAGYVKGANAAVANLARIRQTGGAAIGEVRSVTDSLSFNASGHLLHTIFWNNMKKNGGGEPTAGSAIAEMITRDFGSFAAFQKHFNSAAADVEANGWCSLHYRFSDQRLLVLQTENHQKQIPGDSMALLTIDVWEHAYYLKYQNARAEYIKQWWNLVNWPRVAEHFTKAEAMGKIMAEMP